jgi:hypothetical protein
VLVFDESGTAGLALACPRRASSPLWCLRRCSRPTTGSGDVKRIVGGDNAAGVLGDSCTGVLPLARTRFAPRGWGACERGCGWFCCARGPAAAGDWLGSGLAVGVGNRPQRSGAMGMRRAWAPRMSVGGLAGHPSGRASVLGAAGERAGWGMMAGAATRNLNARPPAPGAARAGKGMYGRRSLRVGPPTRGERR